MAYIIAPTDFSDVSKAAVKYAAHLAVDLGKTLKIIHVIPIPIIYGEVPMPLLENNSYYDEAAISMQQFARELMDFAPTGLAIETSLVQGNPVYELRQMGKQESTYCIVMATHGAGAMQTMLLGSVTLSLVKDAPCPTLVVPDFYTYKRPKSIGLACDFERVVASIPAKAVSQIIQDLEGQLTILHVNAHYAEYEPAFAEEALMVDTLFNHLKPSYHFLHSGYTENSIINYAQAHALDMLIIMPRPHGLLQGLFKHSHTANFIEHAQTPTLVVRCLSR